ncbi:recombinase family protein [Bradyrhizobium sp. 157]|nr:recombinase family protein [Bradyrhizobium sp. 157]
MGYRTNGRTLVIQKAKAKVIRAVFSLYRDTASVAAVEVELHRRKMFRPGSTTMTTGRTYGSRPFSRGEIYRLLASPVYAGDIGHKEKRYPGQHLPIVDRETFTAVQAQPRREQPCPLRPA